MSYVSPAMDFKGRIGSSSACAHAVGGGVCGPGGSETYQSAHTSSTRSLMMSGIMPCPYRKSSDIFVPAQPL